MYKLICLFAVVAPSMVLASPDPVREDSTTLLKGDLLMGVVGTDQMPESTRALGVDAAVGFRLMPERLPDLLLLVGGRYLRTREFERSLIHGDSVPEASYDLSTLANYRVAGGPASRFALHLEAGPYFRSRSSMVLRRHTFGPRGGAHARFLLSPNLTLEAGGGYLRHLVRSENDDGWYAFLGETRSAIDYSGGIAFCQISGDWPGHDARAALRCVHAGYSGETTFFDSGKRNVNTVVLGIRLER